MKHAAYTPRHVLGGLGLTNGVLLHSPDAAVLAVRGADGEIYTHHWSLPPQKTSYKIMQLFGVRGLALLWRTIVWNSRVRAFADNVVKQMTKNSVAAPAPTTQFHAVPSSLFPTLGILAAFLLYGEVVLLINTVYQVTHGQIEMGQSTGLAFLLVLLILIVLVRRGGIWAYMGYHGALHQAIHAFEDGKRTIRAVHLAWPYQARCGAAVVSYVAVLLALVGYLWPNLSGWLSVPLALLLFSVSYEIVLFLDQHDDAIWAKVLALPGVLLQFLVARPPSEDQSGVAAKALYELTHYSTALKLHAQKPANLPLT